MDKDINYGNHAYPLKERYDRLLRLKNYPAEKVFQSLAIVGGVGALGNETAKLLALLGVGKVILVDYDTIEESNLTRSVLFREEDCGEPKVEAAARQMKRINPDVQVIPFNRNIADLGLGIYRRADMIFSGFDSYYPRLVVNEACMITGKTWIDAGLGLDNYRSGTISVYDGYDRDAACWVCQLGYKGYLMHLNEMRGLPGCNERDKINIQKGILPTTPTLASIVSSMQVQAALDILAGSEEENRYWRNSRLTIDLQTRGTTCFPSMLRMKDCIVHDDLLDAPLEEEQIIERPDWISRKTTLREVLAALKNENGDGSYIYLYEGLVGTGSCGSCGKEWSIFMQRSSFTLAQRRGDLCCPNCNGSSFIPDGLYGDLSTIHENLPFLDLTLHQAGLRPLDILRVVAPEREDKKIWHYEVTGDNDNLEKRKTQILFDI